MDKVKIKGSISPDVVSLLFDPKFESYKLSTNLVSNKLEVNLTQPPLETEWKLDSSLTRHKQKYKWNYLFSSLSDETVAYLILKDGAVCQVDLLDGSKGLTTIWKFPEDKIDSKNAGYFAEEVSLVSINCNTKGAFHSFIFLANGLGEMWLLGIDKDTKAVELAQFTPFFSKPFALVSCKICSDSSLLVTAQYIEDGSYSQIKSSTLSTSIQFVSASAGDKSEEASNSLKYKKPKKLNKVPAKYCVGTFKICQKDFSILETSFFIGYSHLQAISIDEENNTLILSDTPFVPVPNSMLKAGNDLAKHELKDYIDKILPTYYPKPKEPPKPQPTLYHYHKQGEEHKLNCYQSLKPGSIMGVQKKPATENAAITLGLEYDVDCIIVDISWNKTTDMPFKITHKETLDALGWLFSNKPDIKFTAFTEQMGVLAEKSKYVYIYQKKRKEDHSSINQIIEIEGNVMGLKASSQAILVLTDKKLYFISLVSTV